MTDQEINLLVRENQQLRERIERLRLMFSPADNKAYEIVGAAFYFVVCGHLHPPEWWQKYFLDHVQQFNSIARVL